METSKPSSNYRAQRKGQNARQAMVISGLSTIYRNNTDTHFIQSQQRTEPRVYLLDITLDDMNKMYSKIHQIIERGRLRPKGTEIYFVTKKMEHIIITDSAIFELRTNDTTRQQTLHERNPVDGTVTTIELQHGNHKIPVLVDESYFELYDVKDKRQIIPTNHIVVRHVKKIVKMHQKSMNAFVFILDENEKDVIDFYMTTENGIISVGTRANNIDRLTRTCKDDIISFIDHFKLCS
ncbi:hypothetical protein EBU71_18410 [bacterium]|jgi:hypothetical protein|nr:hypothetical protein [Candidatus Elulimicrobium humile]